MPSRRAGLYPLLLLLTAVPACHCDDKVTKRGVCEAVPGNQADHPDTCSTRTDCADHHVCSATGDGNGPNCCVFADRSCATEADCCPGQTCIAGAKRCQDKFIECTKDVDCGDRGDRFCEPYTDIYGSSKRCRFKACAKPSDCPSSQSCFQGECLADLPCGGSCESGKGCVPSIDRCQDYRHPSSPEGAVSCPVSCAKGFIATFADNRNVWDSCTLSSVKCLCAELPALHSADVGRFTSIAADAPAKQLVVSHYDGQFGDLVVDRYRPDGEQVSREYVDGVPPGNVRYAPSGPRKGVVDPGDDVGRYSDVAVVEGLTYVSYYDVTHGDLKLATRASDGSWAAFTVDGENADLGLYSSIAADADGLLGIAYFQRGAEASFDPASCPSRLPPGPKSLITALKLARATKKNPGPADFTFQTLACKMRSPPACQDCTQTCADPGAGPGCYAPATTCSGCDANTEACVTVNDTARCARKYNPSTLLEVVDGIGLYPSLAFKERAAIIAFMSRTRSGGPKPVSDGTLLAVQVAGSGAVGPITTIDGEGDTGFFPDVAVDSQKGKIAIGYHDFTSRSLKLYLHDSLATGVTPEVIDNGVFAPGESSWVGASTSMSFNPRDGALFALYQDATRSDLMVARRDTNGGWRKLPALRSEGAVGFFAHGVWLEGALYAGHARLKAKLEGGEPRLENQVLLDRWAPPQ